MPTYEDDMTPSEKLAFGVAVKEEAARLNKGGFEEYLMEALNLTRDQYEKNEAAIDEMITTGKDTLQIAGNDATKSNMHILANMIREENNLKPIKAEKFVGGYKSKAANARADKTAMRAQKRALSELGDRIDPEITDKEQAIFELNRRGQEQDLRGARGAALSSARARGFGGAGAEMQAGLAAQQEGADRRMLEDLAASGMAIDRSESALRDYGGLAGDIRRDSFGEQYKRGTAADDAQRFNRNLRQDYDKYKTRTRQEENRDRWGRSKDIGDRQFGAVADRYNYDTAGQRLDERGTLAQAGVGTAGAQSTASTLGAIAGARQAEDAAGKLGKDDDDDGLFGWGLGPF